VTPADRFIDSEHRPLLDMHLGTFASMPQLLSGVQHRVESITPCSQLLGRMPSVIRNSRISSTLSRPAAADGRGCVETPFLRPPDQPKRHGRFRAPSVSAKRLERCHHTKGAIQPPPFGRVRYARR
jgi:hypothetical protein